MEHIDTAPNQHVRTGDPTPLPTSRIPSPLAEDVASLHLEYARTRDLALRNRVVARYERLVRSLASRFASSGSCSSEDLVQVGFLGLIQAVDRFDPQSQCSFMAFAVPTILGHIKHYLRDHTWAVKAPRRLRELGQNLHKLRAELEQRLGRSPSVQEMAEAAGVDEERLVMAMEVGRLYQIPSLDARPHADSGDGDENGYWDAVGSPDPEIGAVDERECLRTAMRCLDPRQQRIIYCRYFEDRTQDEVARNLGISQMHVSRLERRALMRLKELLS